MQYPGLVDVCRFLETFLVPPTQAMTRGNQAVLGFDCIDLRLTVADAEHPW